MTDSRPPHVANPLLPTPTMSTVKNRRLLTEEEMADKRAKGMVVMRSFRGGIAVLGNNCICWRWTME